jgi:hypothetical protein
MHVLSDRRLEVSAPEQRLAHVAVGHDAEQAVVGVGHERHLATVLRDGLEGRSDGGAGPYAEVLGDARHDGPEGMIDKGPGILKLPGESGTGARPRRRNPPDSLTLHEGRE